MAKSELIAMVALIEVLGTIKAANQPVIMLMLVVTTFTTDATQDHAITSCTIQFKISLDRLLAMLDFSIRSQTANRFLINHTKTLAGKVF